MLVEKHFTNENDTKIYYDQFLVEGANYNFNIIHGSLEHRGRYKELINFLNQNKINVFIMDLRGHGKSIDNKVNVITNTKKSHSHVLSDCLTLNKIIKKISDKPLILFGHSMGSFIARNYAHKYPDTIDKLIISGTSKQNKIFLQISKLIINTMSIFYPLNRESKFLHKSAYASLNKKIKKHGYQHFISTDSKIVDSYLNDSLCNQIVTLDYSLMLVNLIIEMQKKDCYNVKMPIFIFSGELDPLAGKDGNYIKQISEKYRVYNKNITLKLYKNSLHEVHNDAEKDNALEDLISWINKN